MPVAAIAVSSFLPSPFVGRRRGVRLQSVNGKPTIRFGVTAAVTAGGGSGLALVPGIHKGVDKPGGYVVHELPSVPCGPPTKRPPNVSAPFGDQDDQMAIAVAVPTLLVGILGRRRRHLADEIGRVEQPIARSDAFPRRYRIIEGLQDEQGNRKV